MAKTSCIPLSAPLNGPVAVVEGVAAKCRTGLLSLAEGKPKLQLAVSAPPDKYNWIKRIFYGAWSGNCVARALSNGVPALPAFDIRWLPELRALGNALGDIAVTLEKAAVFTKTIGNGLALVEGLIASVDLKMAVQRKARVDAILTVVNRPSATQATRELERKHQNRKTLHRPPTLADHAATALPIEGRQLQRGCDGQSSDSSDTGDKTSLPLATKREAEIAKDANGSVEPQIWNDYLVFTRALSDREEAETKLTASKIAWVRDFIMQGIRATWDLAAETSTFCAAPIATLVSFALSLPVGIGQLVAGIVELAQVCKQETRLRLAKRAAKATLANEVIRLERASPNETQGDREKRVARLQRLSAENGYVRRTFDATQNMRKMGIGWARTLKMWAKARIGYGSFSVATALSGILLSSLGGGAMVATGGLALLIVGVTAGAIWLGFAVYKCVKSNRRTQAETTDKLELEALFEARDKLKYKNKSERKSPSVSSELRSLNELESVASEPGFVDNRYLMALILAKRLTCKEIDSIGRNVEPDAAGPHGDNAKQKRSEASAALQMLGMSKLMTSALKHASFERSVAEIHRYLRGDVGLQSLNNI